MKTFHKLFPFFLICIFVFGLVFSAPTFAAEDNNAVSTTFFGDFKDDGKGCGVYMVLNSALDILSSGIGLAAFIGILVFGILYLTAKGNENQIVKSKKRILEIVIGLAVYTALYAGLNFILPGGKLNTNVQCTATTVSSNYGTTNEWRTKVTGQNDGAKSTSSSSSSSAESSSDETDLSKWYEAMDWTASYMQKAIYGGIGGKCGNNYRSNFSCSKQAGTCVTYPATALQKLGMIKKNTYLWIKAAKSGNSISLVGNASSWVKKHNDVFKIYNYGKKGKTLKQLYKAGNLKKGDIVFHFSGFSSKGETEGHTMIFKGHKEGGDYSFYSCSPPVGKKCMKTNKQYSKNYTISIIIRLKKTSL